MGKEIEGQDSQRETKKERTTETEQRESKGSRDRESETGRDEREIERQGNSLRQVERVLVVMAGIKVRAERQKCPGQAL